MRTTQVSEPGRVSPSITAPRQSRRIVRDPLAWAFAAASAVLLLFVVLPLLSTLVRTPLRLVLETLADAEVLASLALTFYAAAWATALAFVTGVPLAYLLARRSFTGKRWVEGVISLPIVVPHTAAGIALLTVFGRLGPVGQALGGAGIRFTDELPGIVVGMLFVSLPYLVSASREAFTMVDPELEGVALTMGASRWQAFLYVTVPLAIRGIAAGAVMMWGRGISEFGAIVVLAYSPKTVPVLVYERFSGFGLEAALPVTVILILASLGVFVLLQALVARGHDSGAAAE
jgi:molybdate/tungstate transport system permease protein